MSVVGPTLHIEVDEEDVLVALHAVLSATSSVSLALFLENVMEEWLEARAVRRFQNEGDDASGMWLPLMLSTERIRADEGFPPAHPINRRTGELMDWVTSAGGTTTPFSGGAVSGAILSWPEIPRSGELREKYSTAQAGKSSPYTPARPVAAISHTDLAFALEALEKWLIVSMENPSGSWMV